MMGANGATGGVTLTGAGGHFCAAHRAVEGGPIHGHTWRVRVWWHSDGADAEERKATLRLFLTILDHCELPPKLSRAEAIAEYIGRTIVGAPVLVEVWREAEDLFARWSA